MAKSKRLPQQIIKVKNYGDDWVNRLAIVCTTTEKMSSPERQALFKFLQSKYDADFQDSVGY